MDYIFLIAACRYILLEQGDVDIYAQRMGESISVIIQIMSSFRKSEVSGACISILYIQ
jgi:hypothetical protein